MCIVIFAILCLINGFTVFLPSSWSVSSFMSSYVGIPIFVVLYFGHKFTAGKSHSWVIPLDQVDLVTGLDEIKADEDPSHIKESLWTRARNLVRKRRS